MLEHLYSANVLKDLFIFKKQQINLPLNQSFEQDKQFKQWMGI